ncbi:unnamed protein product [Calicophoron daubneyi]|uniref:Metallo-dependent phosphatase n=1 Tax=Calicophoron daubneyi TaxID=300641 RepID=A0AAV2T9A2_CALDB
MAVLLGLLYVIVEFYPSLPTPSNIANHHKTVKNRSISHQLADRIKQKYRHPLHKKRHDTESLAQAKAAYCTDPLLATALLSFRNLNVYVVGEVGHPRARIVRVVHISDTRGAHDVYAEHIPRGHILIHSGDFVPSPPSRGIRLPFWCRQIGDRLPHFRKDGHPRDSGGWRQQVEELDRFFAQQPHEFKIFVPGCWENWYSESKEDPPTPEKIQSVLKSGIYLEDTWCRILGLTVYGTSWTAADDLRSEDGASAGHRWYRHLRLNRPKCLNRAESSESSVNVSHNSVHNEPSVTATPSTVNQRTDGFVLPDIKDVAERWHRIPDDTDIVVSHMPAWRPELFDQIVGRVKPVLHLCGHDFTGYGVMWKRGTLFSNAALQLTPTFPPTGHGKKESKRTGKRPTKPVDTRESGTDSQRLPGVDRPSIVPASFDISDEFCEPQLYTRKPNGRPRPPRWQRRLPASLSRLFFGGGCMPTCSLFRRTLRTKSVVVVSETQSSKAAVEQAGGDVGFIYDPDMRAGIGAMAIADSTLGSGSGAGYSGGSTGFTGSTLCSSMCRRNPIVIDVYVVSDDDTIVLPPYASTAIAHLQESQYRVQSTCTSP